MGACVVSGAGKEGANGVTTEATEQDAYAGVLRREGAYIACCAVCGTEARWEVENRREAEREIRYDGWRQIGEQGAWVCGECGKESKDGN